MKKGTEDEKTGSGPVTTTKLIVITILIFVQNRSMISRLMQVCQLQVCVIKFANHTSLPNQVCQPCKSAQKFANRLEAGTAMQLQTH